MAHLFATGSGSQISHSASSPIPAKKNAKGKKETIAQMKVIYFTDEEGKRIHLAWFLWNVFDRYRFFCCKVEIDNEMHCNVDSRFMYSSTKWAPLEQAGFARPGPSYLPVNTPV
jgi:hypothetical protein